MRIHWKFHEPEDIVRICCVCGMHTVPRISTFRSRRIGRKTEFYCNYCGIAKEAEDSKLRDKEETELEQVTAWKASDGSVFTDKGEAAKYEKDLKLKAALEEIAKDVYYYNMGADTLAKELFERRDELKAALR